jgi:integrase
MVNQLKFKRGERKSILPSYLNDDEFKQVIDVVKNKKHKLAFMLAFNCGLRISEIIKLQKEHIDFAGKKIFIKEGKGKKDRVVPLPKGFPQSYMSYIPMNFKNEKSGIRSLQYSFANAIKKSKIIKTGLHFHSLRHSFAVRCMEKGIPLNQIQILLGHSDISTTSIYLKINPIDALKSYEELW